MKSIFIFVFFGLFLFYSSVSTDGQGTSIQDIKRPDLNVIPRGFQQNSTVAVKPDVNFGKIPLYFIFNEGQLNKKAKFYAKASRYTLWLTREGLVFDSVRKVKIEVKESDTPRPLRGQPSQEGSNQLSHLPYSTHSTHSPKFPRDVSRLVFLNANKNPVIVPGKEAKLKVNYFIGNDPSKWHCDIPTSKAVLYKNLYKSIDLKVYGIEKQIEYDWIVNPGGNPGDIRFEYKNVKGTRIDNQGNLVIETDFGELMHKKPVSYQMRKAQSAKCNAQRTGVGAGLRACPEDRKYVDATFKKIAENTYGFEVGKYDKRLELIIDPVVLAYSTYLGGSGQEWSRGIVVDNKGYAYVTGWTVSSDFPILNQYQTDGLSYEVFISKIDTTASGVSSLVYSTFLGGNGEDYGGGIAADSSGNAYVTGITESKDFPILNQYQAFRSGYIDAFVTKLDTTRSGTGSLIYSTYLGGVERDDGTGIAVDDSGNAYVTGFTKSTNFPRRDQYQKYRKGGKDAFITKIDTTQSGASSLIYSTYLGGERDDSGEAIAVDSSGNVYVTGITESVYFPTLNQFQNYQGGYCDAFVAKINTLKNGASSLCYSTYLCGNGNDRGYGITLDGSGYVYVTGETYSTNFPILNPCQSSQGGYCDAFITKIDTTQSGASCLIYSTYLGGETWDGGTGIAVDSIGNVYVTGETYSTDFPALNHYQTFQGGNGDAFVTKLDTTRDGALALIYSTYLGGNDIERANGIAVDSSGNAYVTGSTYSINFPVLNQYQTYPQREDVFVTKILSFSDPPYIKLNRTRLNFRAIIGESQTGSQAFLISNRGQGILNWAAISNETWIKVIPDNGTGSGQVIVSVDIAGLTPGSHNGTISITDSSATNSPQTVSVTLNIYSSGGTGTARIPFGTFSTPVDGATVRGSIPVTGWVLDDIEVKSVKIYRKQGGANIFIGDAVFVEGARPDVEQAYPQYPFYYRAGWGYMLLTNFLPDGGNGKFTLYALAADKEGNVVTLGTKNIICDNANAFKPFGAIDTPAQGGDASGAEFINFGWALTPQPNTISKAGSTIKVWVDGVPLEGNPVYNRYRKDVAALFPTYNNSKGAGGYYYLDTTLYANSVHTISWSVTDDGGNTDGIGSRYFNIMNVVNPAAASASGFSYDYTHQDNFSIEQLPEAASPVYLKKGYKASSRQNLCYPGNDGVITIEIKEDERIEIQNPSCGYNCGYMVVGHQLKPLPIGSFLDNRRGIFYWQVGPGFIGKYRLLFIVRGHNGEFKRELINIMVHPKY